MIYSDYAKTQKQIFDICIEEIESKLNWQLAEIKKLEQSEMTENRFKSIQSRKKDVEKWFELLTLVKDLNTIENKKNEEYEKEITFLKSMVEMNYKENNFWMQKAKEFLNDKN
jgi:hypothetical protein